MSGTVDSIYQGAPLGDVNIVACERLLTPAELGAQLPVSARAGETIQAGRRAVRAILDGRERRILVVVGPCSVHDVEAALEYAGRLKKLADAVGDRLLIAMRVYFEKPRTTVGWKGLINDPHMDDSFAVEEGFKIARRLLLDIAELGLPACTEALDPISPQYIQDLISWSAIGARTTESQTHREMASGLSSAVGFKNGTDGGLTVAINALQSVARPHRFLGISSAGEVSVFHSRGNPYAHLVLRGGSKPNYDSVSVQLAANRLREAGLKPNIMVDCSHANSNKDHRLQPLVLENVTNQIVAGDRTIMGVMVESNLGAGNQPIPADLAKLEYGVSVTDACMDWATTEAALRTMHERLAAVDLGGGSAGETVGAVAAA
ncbi:MAG: 3-deoxy-7-phosphoheptulonate synthase [Cellvibrionales bacterium]|nr:3-deoxy-7-phosphoheptulonate synthase [Cellvibrionales bacterium]